MTSKITRATGTLTRATSKLTELTGSATGRNSNAAEKQSLLHRVRLGVFYLALVLAGVMTVLFLPDLLVLLALGWTAAVGVELGIHRLHTMGIALVVGIFLIGLFAQAYRPTARVASMWGAFLTILVISAGTVGFAVGRPEEVLPFLVLTTVALIAHPAGRGLFERVNAVSIPLLALVTIAAVPLFAFMLSQYSLTASGDSHAVMGHYVMMAGLAFAPLAFGAAAALGFTGRRLASWLAATAMAYYGLMSVAFPLQSGSTGAMWGLAAIVWAVAFVVATEYTKRSDTGVLIDDQPEHPDTQTI